MGRRRVLPRASAVTVLPAAALALFLLAQDAPAQRRRTLPGNPDQLAPISLRSDLRQITGDLARAGLVEEVLLMEDLLPRLGDRERDLVPFERIWDRSLRQAQGKPAPTSEERGQLLARLAVIVDDLGRHLPTLGPEHRSELAGLLLQLDAGSVPANEELGRVEANGRWWTPEEARRREDATRLLERVREARALPVEVEHGPAEAPFLRARFEDDAHRVTAAGVVLEGPLPPETLERLLGSVVRAAALSRAVLEGVLEPPALDAECRLVLLPSQADWGAAVEETLAAGASPEEADRLLAAGSYPDDRGWRTVRSGSAAGFAAVALLDLLQRWLGDDVQPCLVAGHLGWLSLGMLGAPPPVVAADERPPEHTEAPGAIPLDDALWRASRTSLAGCREWMRRRVLAEAELPFARAVVPDLAEIEGGALVKAILVAQYLAERGELGDVLEGTRGREDRVAALEASLGRELPELEADWRAWLLGEEERRGVAQRLAEPAPSEEALDSFLATLRNLRRRALSGLTPPAEPVELVGILGRGAHAHARYLARNAERLSSPAQLVEEEASRPGFSVDGARSAPACLTYPGADPEHALDAWMASIPARLALLDPGLVGTGFATGPAGIVVDAGSLVSPWPGDAWVVWPPPGGRDVPRHAAPVLHDSSRGSGEPLGYPITVRRHRPRECDSLALELSLWRGTHEEPEPVPARLVTPGEAALPEDAWALLPLEPLEPDAEHTVLVHGPDGEELRWSFRTAAERDG